MPERKRRLKILLLHAVLLPTLLYVSTFFTLAPLPRTGAGETTLEQAAGLQHRDAPARLITTDRGRLLLFAGLIGGVIVGFAAGWYWHRPVKGPGNPQD